MENIHNTVQNSTLIQNSINFLSSQATNGMELVSNLGSRICSSLGRESCEIALPEVNYVTAMGIGAAVTVTAAALYALSSSRVAPSLPEIENLEIEIAPSYLNEISDEEFAARLQEMEVRLAAMRAEEEAINEAAAIEIANTPEVEAPRPSLLARISSGASAFASKLTNAIVSALRSLSNFFTAFFTRSAKV